MLAGSRDFLVSGQVVGPSANGVDAFRLLGLKHVSTLVRVWRSMMRLITKGQRWTWEQRRGFPTWIVVLVM